MDLVKWQLNFGSCNFGLKSYLSSLIVPFLVRFGGISGEFGRTMVRIVARRSRAKIPIPNEPDVPPKRTKKVRLGIYRTQIFSSKFSVTVIKSARRYTEL